ncbi:PREDICTED: prefoldin subunit 5 [Dufourea novaeangliae]|uniref:Prefoldin subunit 5 n=1 Tax=Dufourea novaeangliae TaxID=178035 RepID=A0A154PC88_DUFNO|nr:PREDICTED: prefoldin subunit 5 [Dufourea novaeangliae]KZC09397.1 Prefoldin subunit 5 [Dufourea novaeangliae]
MSEISMAESPHLKQVDLTTLNLQQLTVLKQQLDRELGVFHDSLQTLKIAQSKFQESGSCLEKITPTMKGNEILVPLTGSMYVAGKLADTTNVLVDIGTGYYAQKSVPDAKNYFDRRVAYVTEQMEKIQQLGLDKSKVRDATVDVIEMKLQSQMQKEVPEHA